MESSHRLHCFGSPTLRHDYSSGQPGSRASSLLNDPYSSNCAYVLFVAIMLLILGSSLTLCIAARSTLARAPPYSWQVQYRARLLRLLAGVPSGSGRLVTPPRGGEAGPQGA